MIKVGIIGLGYWGKNHKRTFDSLLECKVTATCDFDSSIKTDYHNAHELIEDEKIDAVVIATDADTHYELTMEALEHDKHVLCEKPMCLTSEEARSILDCVNETKKIFMTGHTYLFNAAIQQIKKDLLNEKLMGRLLTAHTVRINHGPIRKDVNVVYDLATHDVAIFNHLLEAIPVSVWAVGVDVLRQGNTDLASINLLYPGNLLVTIDVNWVAPTKIRDLKIITQKSIIGFNDKPLPGAYEPLWVQAQDFLFNIQNNPKEYKSDAFFSWGVIKTLEAVNESIKLCGEKVEVSE